jgi:hypothetical protein
MEDLQRHQEFTHERAHQGHAVHDLGPLMLRKMIVTIAVLSGLTAAKNAMRNRLE